MAITDKVIELSPVNKKKNIIFYIIMGVLLATTVLFLVLYLIKPNVTPGEVTGLKITNNLFVKDDGKLLAVRGETYTLCATVGYTGGVDTYVEFEEVNGNNCVTIEPVFETSADDEKSAVYNAAVDGEIKPDADTKIFYFKMTVSRSANAAMEGASVLARVGTKDGEGNKRETQRFSVPVTFDIDDIGAADAEVSKVSYSKNTNSSFAVTQSGGEYNVVLPYVHLDTSGGQGSPFANYNVWLDVKPFVDRFGQVAEIPSLAVGSNRTDTVEAVSSNTRVASVIGVYSTDAGSYLSFDAAGEGNAKITLTFNRHNSSPERNVVINVKTVNTDSSPAVTEMFLMPDKLTEQQPDYSQSASYVEMFVGDSLNLEEFVAVRPYNLQSSFWASDPNIEIISGGDGEDATVLGRTSAAGSFRRSVLQANKTGTATVVVTDKNGLGAKLTFKVKVTYQAKWFGYFDAKEDANKPLSAHTEKAVKGAGGTITVTYVFEIPNVTKIKSSEFNANLITDKDYDPDCGITFTGRDKNGVIPMTPIMTVEGRYVHMEATLQYKVANDISAEPVSVRFLPDTPALQTEAFTVTFRPQTVATDMEFVNESRFEQLLENESSSLVKKYARYENNGVTATLTLNMNDAVNHGQYTNMTVGDLLHGFYIKNSNKFDAEITSEQVKATLKMESSAVGFSSRDYLNARILPTRVATEGGTAQLELAFDGGATLILNIVVIDNPEKITVNGQSGAVKGTDFVYGRGTALATPFRVSLPSVEHVYVSGNVRDPAPYSIAIFINNRVSFLHATPKLYTGLSYFLLEKDYTEGMADDDVRAKALFSVSGNGTNAPKALNLLRDLYAMSANGEIPAVEKIGVMYYFGSEILSGGVLMSDPSALTYEFSLIREVDRIIINDEKLTEDEKGNYSGPATSGSTFTVALTARIEIGENIYSDEVYGISTTSDDNSFHGIHGRLTRLSVYVSDGVKHGENSLVFTMPGVETNGYKDVTVTFATGNAERTKTTVTYRVQNLTLGLSGVELFKTNNGGTLSDPIADGEEIRLSAEKTPSGGRRNSFVVYYKLTYPAGGSSSYVMYDGVNYLTDRNGMINTYASELSSEIEKSWAPNDNPSAAGAKREYIGEFRIDADGGKIGTTRITLQSQMSEAVKSVSFTVHVYAPAESIEFTDSDNNTYLPDAANKAIALDIKNAGDKPSVSLTLEKMFDKEDYYTDTVGGTEFDVSVAGCDEGALGYNFDKPAGRLTFTSKGVALSSGTVTVTVTEKTGSVTVGTYTVTLDIAVDVYVYKVALTVDGVKPSAAVEYTTDGSNREHKISLGAEFNGGVSGLDSPVNVDDLKYVVTKNGTPVASAATDAAFKAVEESGVWYLVYNDSATTLGTDKYAVFASVGGVESERTALNLKTTKRDVGFVNSSDRNIFDITKTESVAAIVYIGGTSTEDKDAKALYKITDVSGNAYAAGKGPATVSADGILTVGISSGDFKVVAYYGNEQAEITVHVNNKVSGITVNFEGKTENSNGSAAIERIYNGTSDCDISLDGMITLYGSDNRAPYTTTDWDIVAANGSVLRYDRDNNKLVLTGTGTQYITVQAKSTPSSTYDVFKTVYVTVVSPFVDASIDGSAAAKTVNLLSETEVLEFAVSAVSSDKNYALEGVTVTGSGIDGGRFVYEDGKLKLIKSAFATDNLTTPSVYKFTVGGRIGGFEVAEENKTEITIVVTADFAKPDSPLFTVKNGASPLESGATLAFKDGASGVVTVTANRDNVTLFVSGDANPSIGEDGKLYFTDVGNITVSARLTGYGKTFEAGQMQFTVKNGVSSISEILSLVKSDGGKEEITTTDPIDADYSSNADKLILEYEIDLSNTGDSFALSDITAHFVGNITVVSAPSAITDGKAIWRIRVDGAGSVGLWVSAEKDGRQYVSDGKKASFAISGMYGDFTLNEVGTLVPGQRPTLTYTFDCDAEFKGDTTVLYTVVSGNNLLEIPTANVGEAVAKLTENGGTARVKAELHIVSGAHAGTVLEDVIDVEVSGVKKTTLAAKESKVYLFGADGVKSCDVSDLFDYVADTGIGSESRALTSRITSGSAYATLAGNTLTARSTQSGGEVKVEVTVTCTGGAWGRYSVSETFSVYVLPEARFGASYYSAAKGDTVRLSVANAGEASVTAAYSVTGGAGLVSVNGDVVTAIAGGESEITATPVVTSGMFRGMSLAPVTVKVYVRELKLNDGAKITVASGSSVEILLNNFTFLGLRDQSSVGSLRSISSDSPLVSVSGMFVNALTGSNAYLAGTSVPSPKTVYVNVIAADGENSTYTAVIPVEITPTPITVTSSLSQTSVKAETGEKLEYTLTVKNVSNMSGSDCVVLVNGKLTERASFAASVSGADTVLKVSYTAKEGDTSLTVHVKIYGTEYTVSELGITVVATPSVSLSANASDKIAAGGEVTNEYTVTAAGGKFNKITLDGLAANATVTAAGATVSGNTLTVSGGAETLTFKVSSASVGRIAFTPKVTVVSSDSSERVIALSAVSFDVVDVGALRISTLVRGEEKNRFKAEDTVVISVSLTSGLDFTPVIALKEQYAGAALSGGVLTVNAAGEITVLVNATVAGKALSEEVTLNFETEPSVTVFSYAADGTMTLTATGLESGVRKSFAVVYGSEYGSVNSVSGEVTKIHGRTDGKFVVRVTYVVTDVLSPFYGRSYSKDAEVSVEKETAPEFNAELSASDPFTVNLSAGFENIVAIVTSGNAEISVSGSTATLTYTAAGNVTVVFYGAYDNENSVYDGEIFTCGLTVENTEAMPDESSQTVALNGLKISLTGENAKIVGVTKNGGSDSVAAVAVDGKSADVDMSLLLRQTSELTVSVERETVHYGTKRYTYNVTVTGIEYDAVTGELSVPAYMTGEVSVASETENVTVEYSEGKLFASTSNSELAGESWVRVTVTVGDEAFTFDYTMNVVYEEVTEP